MNDQIKKTVPDIEVKNVSMDLGGVPIFKNANLKVGKGEAVVIIGPSGGGKTVLLKTIAGVHKPTQGRVLVEGVDWQDLDSQGRHDLARRIGMLFQEGALFDSLSVLDNVAFPLREHNENKDRSDKEILEVSKDLLGKVNLGGMDTKLPYELSGGMQKRLGIARALALNPQIIFYDDPTAGQDPVQSEQMADLIYDLKNQFNSTVVLVTSDMHVAYQIADRIIMVVGEDVVDCGSPQETKDNPDPRVQQFIHGRLEGPIDIRSF